MTSRIEWVLESCELLDGIGAEFERTRPFDGLTIGTGIHLEPKTVALLLTLQRGGASVVSTGNLGSTQPAAVSYLREHGISVIGGPTHDPAERLGHLDGVLDAQPQLILDNGGDLFVRYLERPHLGLRGGTEETTSGRNRLAELRGWLRMPILVINDSPIKLFAENRHGVGQSTLESYLRITNRTTNGRRVVVFGYGSCGRGVASYFRDDRARVAVVEVDPVARLEALLDGYDVPQKAEALGMADVVITITGARDVITASDLGALRDGVILANAGHFPTEIDLPGIEAHPGVTERLPSTEGMLTLRLADGRRIHILGEGHMVNLAGPHALGNSIESMDLGFSLQALSLEAVARGSVDATSCVVPVPRLIDEKVASAYVAIHAPAR
ncbi:adenosylhomocysteinase [soil metagenome]